MWTFKRYEGMFYTGGRHIHGKIKYGVSAILGTGYFEIEFRKYDQEYIGRYKSVFWCLHKKQDKKPSYKDEIAGKEQAEYDKAFDEFTKR
jgi:hypothetical protein